MTDALQWFFNAWRDDLPAASWLVIVGLGSIVTYHLFAVFLLMWTARRRDADDTAYDMERRTRNAGNDYGLQVPLNDPRISLYDTDSWMPGRVAVRPDAASFDTMAALRDARLADRKRRKRLADRKRRAAAQ